MLYLLQMGRSKVLTTLDSSHSWSCLSCCVLTRSTVISSSDSSDLHTSTVQFDPPLLMQHFRLTLVFKPLIPGRPMVLQWNAGCLRVRSTELIHFFSTHPVDRCIQESNLNSSSSFRISGFSARRSDLIHSWSGILSRDVTHASGGVIIFVRQGLSFSELSTSFLSSPHPYSDYVWVSISFNNSSSLSFIIVYASLFALFRRIAEPTPFLSPPEISSFWGTSIAITPSGTQKVVPTPVGRKYSIESSLLTSFPSMTLIYLLFSIVPPLTSRLVPPLSPFPVPGRWFSTWVLIAYQFLYLSLSLRSFATTSVPLP